MSLVSPQPPPPPAPSPWPHPTRDAGVPSASSRPPASPRRRPRASPLLPQILGRLASLIARHRCDRCEAGARPRASHRAEHEHRVAGGAKAEPPSAGRRWCWGCRQRHHHNKAAADIDTSWPCFASPFCRHYRAFWHSPPLARALLASYYKVDERELSYLSPSSGEAGSDAHQLIGEVAMLHPHCYHHKLSGNLPP